MVSYLFFIILSKNLFVLRNQSTYFHKLFDVEEEIRVLKKQEQALKKQEQALKEQEQALKEQEQALKEQALEEERVEKLKQLFSRGLNALYSAEITSSLFKYLPAAIFQTGIVVPQENFQNAVRMIFPNISEANVKLESRNIWDIIYGESQSKIEELDDTPDFIIDENNVLVIKNSCSEFYPFKYLFVRDCYIKLYPKLVEAAKNTVVALIGDPGIGKSTFLRYVFANIVGNQNHPRQKVFWIMESGFWRYYDGMNMFSGKDNTDLWIDPEVLLLIDGAFKNKHLHRTRNVILFCSPQHQNYEKMIKASSGAIFVMPAWDLAEIKKFIDLEIEVETKDDSKGKEKGNKNRDNTSTSTAVVKKNILCHIMKVFYDRIYRQARNEAQQAENQNDIDGIINFNC